MHLRQVLRLARLVVAANTLPHVLAPLGQSAQHLGPARCLQLGEGGPQLGVVQLHRRIQQQGRDGGAEHFQRGDELTHTVMFHHTGEPHFGERIRYQRHHGHPHCQAENCRVVAAGER